MKNNVTYKWAEKTNVAQIVALFEQCLGSAGGAPTVEFWNWKHHSNSAGPSPVILAWDGDKLVGIRAFMCFKFHNNQEIIKAYRPVDTATHPDYQGKGIFRDLTLTLIEDLKGLNQEAFIFNTPNEQSKPGYIKMGWIEWGKPLLQILPTFPISFDSFAKDQASLLTYDFSKVVVNPTHRTTVCKESAYYQWRYQQIPMKQYGMKEVKEGGNVYLIIYRRKKIKFLNEFRICDVLKNNVSCDMVPVAVVIKLFFSFGFGFMSFITNVQFWITLKLKKKSPLVTYRKINEQDAMLPFQAVDWNIGELELF